MSGFYRIRNLDEGKDRFNMGNATNHQLSGPKISAPQKETFDNKLQPISMRSAGMDHGQYGGLGSQEHSSTHLFAKRKGHHHRQEHAKIKNHKRHGNHPQDHNIGSNVVSVLVQGPLTTATVVQDYNKFSRHRSHNNKLAPVSNSSHKNAANAVKDDMAPTTVLTKAELHLPEIPSTAFSMVSLNNKDVEPAKPSMEEEFMIAADLTLYTNPLNSALSTQSNTNISSTSAKPQQTDHDAKEKDNEEEDTIAADLTKYDSPMAELDKAHDAKSKKAP